MTVEGEEEPGVVVDDVSIVGENVPLNGLLQENSQQGRTNLASDDLHAGGTIIGLPRKNVAVTDHVGVLAERLRESLAASVVSLLARLLQLPVTNRFAYLNFIVDTAYRQYESGLFSHGV